MVVHCFLFVVDSFLCSLLIGFFVRAMTWISCFLHRTGWTVVYSFNFRCLCISLALIIRISFLMAYFLASLTEVSLSILVSLSTSDSFDVSSSSRLLLWCREGGDSWSGTGWKLLWEIVEVDDTRLGLGKALNPLLGGCVGSGILSKGSLWMGISILSTFVGGQGQTRETTYVFNKSKGVISLLYILIELELFVSLELPNRGLGRDAPSNHE